MLKRRAGRPLSGLSALIEPDLKLWASEANTKDGGSEPRGHATENEIAKLQREGYMGAGQSGATRPPMSDRALAVDVMIASLRPRQARALKLYYLKHRENQKMAAYEFGRGNRWFRECLFQGRVELAIRLLPNSAL